MVTRLRPFWQKYARSLRVRFRTAITPCTPIHLGAAQAFAHGIVPAPAVELPSNLHSFSTWRAIQDVTHRTTSQAIRKDWLRSPMFQATNYLKPGRIHASMHGTTRPATRTPISA